MLEGSAAAPVARHSAVQGGVSAPSASVAGGSRAKNFSDRAAGQASNPRIQWSNSGGNAFGDTFIEVGKRRWNPFTEGGFQPGAKDSRLHEYTETISYTEHLFGMSMPR